MMKEQFQIEEISKAIDAMNSKKPFHPTDDEVEQLMNTAMYIKQYGCTAEETAIVSQLAKQISSDITTRRRRKRLLSAVAGVAAAALLFAGVSFQMPSEIAQEQSKESIQSPQVAVAENPNATVTRDNNKIIESLPASSSQPTPKIARSVKPEELPRSAKASSTPEVKKDLEVKEQPQVVAEAPKSGNTVLMILPDRSADSVSTEASGTVRQVYGKNTEKEIIVTQRSKNRATDKTAVASDLPAAPSVANQTRTTAAALNKATRNVNGMEVVVEGKQTQAELEKVADSLVPAAETDSKRKEDSP